MFTKFTVSNLYEYLIYFCEIQKLLDKYDFEQKLKQAIIREKNMIGNIISKINMIITEDQKKIY